MNAKLICYDLKKLSQVKKVDVNRALFGYTEYSNNAKYTYKRQGLLEKMPHLRLAKAVIIVENKNGNKIIRTLKKNKAKYKMFSIMVSKSILH